MIRLRVTRPLSLGGVRVEAGKVLSVDAATAVLLQDSGRAELIDSDDEAFLRAERKTALSRVMASLPKSPAMTPEQGPWIPALGPRQAAPRWSDLVH